MSSQNIGSRALVTGIYRCTGEGMTIHCKDGEEFPFCGCSKGCQWELLANDNMNPEDIIEVIATSCLYVVKIDFLPEVGIQLNLRVQLTGNGGLYKIFRVNENFIYNGKKGIYISVHNLGNFDKSLPIHEITESWNEDVL